MDGSERRSKLASDAFPSVGHDQEVRHVADFLPQPEPRCPVHQLDRAGRARCNECVGAAVRHRSNLAVGDPVRKRSPSGPSTPSRPAASVALLGLDEPEPRDELQEGPGLLGDASPTVEVAGPYYATTKLRGSIDLCLSLQFGQEFLSCLGVSWLHAFYHAVK